MFAGMAVLGMPAGGRWAPSGSSWSRAAPTTRPALMFLGMAVDDDRADGRLDALPRPRLAREHGDVGVDVRCRRSPSSRCSAAGVVDRHRRPAGRRARRDAAGMLAVMLLRPAEYTHHHAARPHAASSGDRLTPSESGLAETTRLRWPLVLSSPPLGRPHSARAAAGDASPRAATNALVGPPCAPAAAVTRRRSTHPPSTHGALRPKENFKCNPQSIRGAGRPWPSSRSRSSWSSWTPRSSASPCPRSSADLGFSPEDLSWVFNAYVIAFGGLLLLGGRLSDLFGAKRRLHRRLGRPRRRLAGRRPRRLHRASRSPLAPSRAPARR